ncbi:TetR/AcrR family transcriptional regulator [Kitasatospora sp. NPDC089797]|uniref:TetR/AcrR family transcriptional regulator n=1 Tax=Kitasatospora sp. NPDC089797 TaxID=3155298 RepID=UPI0034446E00
MAKQERARRTREKALTAAAEIFAAHGYESTTLNTVADRIGMTKGALYGHFPSKGSLARALIDESRTTWTSLRAEYDTPGADAAEVLEAVVVGFADRLRSDVRLRAALRLAADCPGLAQSPADVLAEMHVGLTELVHRAQRDGGFPEHSPSLVAELLLVVIRGLLNSRPACGDSAPAPGGEPLWQLLFTALTGSAGCTGSAGRPALPRP